MSPRHHVVITGTGRAGTTFLVELLTHLGLETGFSVDDIPQKKYQEARAGLEYELKNPKCPFIVKTTFFCDYAEDVIHQKDIIIEHVFIPIRNLHAAAESRRYVSKDSLAKLPLRQRIKHIIRPRRFPGGLLHTKSNEPGQQEDVLLRQIYNLVYALSDSDIPITLLRYPRITKDSKYLFDKLNPLLKNIDFESFCSVFNKVARPELVHSFNPEDC